MPRKFPVSYEDTGFYSSLFLDYVQGKETLLPLIGGVPTLESVQKQLETRSFSEEKRKVLCEVLEEQHEAYSGKIPEVRQALDALAETSTCTVTTGHQLCLGLGPQFTANKIASIVALAKSVSTPERQVVPIFWMATEDHDREEIDHFYVRGKKYAWKTEQTGAVGRFGTAGIDQVLDELEQTEQDAVFLKEFMPVLREAYTQETLTAATRHLAMALFGSYGVLCLDADDMRLKRLFVPQMRQEIQRHTSFEAVNEQNALLKAQGYKLQVNPRPVNFFYMEGDRRSRIDAVEGGFETEDGTQHFSETDLLNLIEEHPERLSPNVVLRPVYQEVILPNVAYVGGPGELAYWLQLPQAFKQLDVPYPVVAPRNFIGWLSAKAYKRMTQLDLPLEDVLKGEHEAFKAWMQRAKSWDNLEEERNRVGEVFEELQQRMGPLDESLVVHLKAIQKKTDDLLVGVNKKALRAEKGKETDALRWVEEVLTELQPGGGIAERKESLWTLYLNFGDQVIEQLMEHAEGIPQGFNVLVQD